MMKISSKQNMYINRANRRWNFKGGATRSGKTYLDVRWIIPMRIRERIGLDGLCVILGVTKSTIERNILSPMRAIYGESLVGNISSDNTVKLFGEKCYALGAEKLTQVSKIRGASIKYCYGDEVADWSEDVFELLKSRLDREYSLFDGTYNPQYPEHWLKKFLDSDADIFSQVYTLSDNPFLPMSFRENLMREYKGTVYYDRYILGKWVLAEGLVYDFSESNIVDGIPDHMENGGEYYISVDYGTMNPFSAGLWLLNGGKAVRVGEYYYNGREKRTLMTDEDYCREIERLADGREISRIVVDPSAASFITALKRHGWRVKKAKNEVLNGIRQVAVQLSLGNVKISRSCRDCIREFGLYRWDADSDEDKVIKENDHAMDDLRYFVATVLNQRAKQNSRHA